MRFLLLLLLCLHASGSAMEHKPRVFAAIPPLKYLADAIGGDLVNTESFLKLGQSPVSFEPSPQQIERFSSAVLYIGSNLPFEVQWKQRLLEQNPDILVINATDHSVIKSEAVHHHHHGDDHHSENHHDKDHHGDDEKHHRSEHDDEEHHSGHHHEKDHHGDDEKHHRAEHDDKKQHILVDHHDLDPHVWTSVANVIVIADEIRKELTLLMPAEQKKFQANFAGFKAKFSQLGKDIKAQLDQVQQRKFLVFHPAWGYFAAEFGLEQISIEAEGKAPTAHQLAKIIKEAKKHNFKSIFIQPAFRHASAQIVAKELGAKTYILDPLEYDLHQSLIEITKALVDP